MDTKELQAIKSAAGLYYRAARGLNGFFSRRLSACCSDCLGFIKENYPEDILSSMNLSEGIFPGCCQGGVDLDFRIAGAGNFPDSLVNEIKSGRNAELKRTSCAYAIEDAISQEVKRGQGCGWLSAAGCSLGERKSILCLTFICEPARRRLSEDANGANWPFEEDFCGAVKAFCAIAEAASDYSKLEKAKSLVNCLEKILEESEREIGEKASKKR